MSSSRTQVKLPTDEDPTLSVTTVDTKTSTIMGKDEPNTEYKYQTEMEKFTKAHERGAGGPTEAVPQISRDPLTDELILNPHLSSLNPNVEEAKEKDKKHGTFRR
ncbi:hypothetical protein C9374_007019 [Naegleria lovaniensis]|uniref:Uncharacterized protein n=1 Tax=Naegleria lovaniensis TaxID=51637 RepID=A0AA88KPS2_NAELO|nr:uncharacterized protein C9374_007019 [Naegleria lovaniensis]KAG2393488.1 hypothetical protein C9374_007019 [Naegleria lovaniensis]